MKCQFYDEISDEWKELRKLIPLSKKDEKFSIVYTSVPFPSLYTGTKVDSRSWLRSIGLSIDYTGIVVSIQEESEDDSYSRVFMNDATNVYVSRYDLPNNIRWMDNPKGYTQINYSMDQFSISVFRFKDGLLHCEYGYATESCDVGSYRLQTDNRRKFVFGELAKKLSTVESLNLNSQWYSYGYKTNGFYLNGEKLTQKTHKGFIKSGTRPEKGEMTPRIKLTGSISIGEELSVNGEDHTGRIILVRIGQELNVLAPLHRNTTKHDGWIKSTCERMSIDPEKDLGTKYFERTLEELEDLFLDNAGFLAKSITKY
jgi:hypothetical protein